MYIHQTPRYNFTLCAPAKSHQLSPLSSDHTSRLMENAKRVGKKLQESQKSKEQMLRQDRQFNIEFRTIDKDLNTIRPDLMKLQERKEALSQ